MPLHANCAISVPNNSTRLYPKTVPPYPTIVPNRTPKPYNRTTPYHKTLPLYHTVSQSRTSKLYKLVSFRRVGTVRVYPKTVPRETVPQNRTPEPYPENRTQIRTYIDIPGASRREQISWILGISGFNPEILQKPGNLI